MAGRVATSNLGLRLSVLYLPAVAPPPMLHPPAIAPPPAPPLLPPPPTHTHTAVPRPSVVGRCPLLRPDASRRHQGGCTARLVHVLFHAIPKVPILSDRLQTHRVRPPRPTAPKVTQVLPLSLPPPPSAPHGAAGRSTRTVVRGRCSLPPRHLRTGTLTSTAQAAASCHHAAAMPMHASRPPPQAAPSLPPRSSLLRRPPGCSPPPHPPWLTCKPVQTTHHIKHPAAHTLLRPPPGLRGQEWGRFPHRNAILGRASTPEEAAGLAAGSIAKF